MKLRALSFILCLLLANVLKSCWGQGTQTTASSCSGSCGDLATRVAQLEAKWANLASLFAEGQCPDSGTPPQYQCEKEMSSPGTPARVTVQVAGDVEALCDTVADGGGWIVIQRRTDGGEDFYRDWDTYKNGFGTVQGDYWLGNEAIHTLTSSGNYEIRLDINHNGTMYYARYSSFVVGDEASGYIMTLGSYSGTAPDSFSYHNNMKFSTFDRENDAHASVDCAELNHGGWWYKGCNYVHLNGKWGPNADAIGGYLAAVRWNGLSPKDGPYLSFTEMKIRRA